MRVVRRRAGRGRRGAQSLLDEGQRTLESAAIVRHERVRGAAGRSSQIRLIEIQRHGLGETLHVMDLTRGASLERHRAYLFEMEHVRSEHDRDFHGAGLEEVLPAVRHQAAADERYVGGRVEPLQFAHRIADEHLGADGQGGRRSAAQRD